MLSRIKTGKFEPMSIKIGIVDDKVVNRNTLINKIEPFDDLEVVFVAESGDDCLEQLKGLPQKKVPEVIFMDLEMPGLNGIQTIDIARALYPSIFFIVLTVFDDEDKLFDAIKAGAHGYLLKEENAIALHNAIINVMENGGAPMSPAIARKAMDLLSKAHLKEKSTEVKQDDTLTGLLSEREKEVLQHTINGLDAKHIAEKLNISVLTIRKHIANVYEKLHVNSKAQVISLAYQKKWFE